MAPGEEQDLRSFVGPPVLVGCNQTKVKKTNVFSTRLKGQTVKQTAGKGSNRSIGSSKSSIFFVASRLVLSILCPHQNVLVLKSVASQ